MSINPFHNDECIFRKELHESTATGKYMLNVPNNGDNSCFSEDPFIRLQKWGANLRTNAINVESDLIGLSRSNTRDNINKNQYNVNKVKSTSVAYPVCKPMTEQSRTTHPAWTVRDLEQVKWTKLLINPQENTCFPFNNNLSTRLIERDNHITCIPNKPQ